MADTIKVVLAMRPGHDREALQKRLVHLIAESFPNDIKIEAREVRPVQLLKEIKRCEPHVVLLSMTGTSPMPERCTDLLDDFPGLVVLGLLPGNKLAWLYRRKTTRRVIRRPSATKLLQTIRRVIVEDEPDRDFP